MIVKWINNIVDYKCKVIIFFFSKRYKSILFFMLVYVLKKDISNGSQTRVSGAGGGCSNKEHHRLQGLERLFLRSGEWGLHTAFTGIHICYIDILQWVLMRHLRTFFFCCFLWFSLSSLRFLPPGVGLTGSSRPSKVLLEFKALILKTEHKQTLQSVVMLDCIEWILIDREDISHLG